MKKLMRFGVVLSAMATLVLGGCAQSSNQPASPGTSAKPGLVENKEPKKVTEEELSNKLLSLMEKETEKKIAAETDKQQADMAKAMASKMIKPMSQCIAKLMIENDEQEAIKGTMEADTLNEFDDLDKKLKSPDKMKEGMNACMKEKGLDSPK